MSTPTHYIATRTPSGSERVEVAAVFDSFWSAEAGRPEGTRVIGIAGVTYATRQIRTGDRLRIDSARGAARIALPPHANDDIDGDPL